MLLVDIRKHNKSYKEFLTFLHTKDIKNISAYLGLRDELAYGFILEFIETKGAAIIINKGVVSIIINDSNPIFGCTIEHRGLRFIYHNNLNDKNATFVLCMNDGINNFFRLLDENIVF